MTRFTAILGMTRLNAREGEHLVSTISATIGPTRRFDLKGVTVLTPEDCLIEENVDGGLVIGHRFEHSNLDAGCRGRVNRHDIPGCGRQLAIFDRSWGDFFFVSPGLDDRPATVARAPMGGISCYYTRVGELTVITTHIRDIQSAMRVNPQVDWNQVTRLLAFEQLRTVETCLVGISELFGGQCLQFADAAAKRVSFWSPWLSCRRDAQILDYEEAVATVRKAVLQTIATRARQFSRIVLTVSGGLDSSIVAASLQNAGVSFSCLTMFTQEKAGDEREYARKLTGHFGIDLLELPESLNDIDLERSGAADLPRPTSHAFSQSSDAAQIRIAGNIGADAFFTGGGGDSVFCYLASVTPVADCLREPRHWPKALGVADDIAAMTGTGIPTVILRGMRRAWLRRARYPWPRTDSLLSDSVVSLAPVSHPWLNVPRGGYPGKAGHIASLIAIQNNLEGYIREEVAPVVHPLMSLPIIEACLRVPSWMWCSGGRNRAVARDAFADLLPAAVVRRSTKGTPGGFIAKIYNEKRSQIRELLLDGLLASNDVLNRGALERLLADTFSVKTYDYLRVMLMVDAEAWARCWHTPGQSARAIAGTSQSIVTSARTCGSDSAPRRVPRRDI